MKKFLALSLSYVVFIMLINVKMPTIVGILIFMSRINFLLSPVEYGKSFITLGPVLSLFCYFFFNDLLVLLSASESQRPPKLVIGIKT